MPFKITVFSHQHLTYQTHYQVSDETVRVETAHTPPSLIIFVCLAFLFWLAQSRGLGTNQCNGTTKMFSSYSIPLYLHIGTGEHGIRWYAIRHLVRFTSDVQRRTYRRRLSQVNKHAWSPSNVTFLRQHLNWVQARVRTIAVIPGPYHLFSIVIYIITIF